jgi:hypothetical protein
MSEKKLNDHLQSILDGHWEAQRLESPLTNLGIPDWTYSLPLARGYIESKFKKSWPKKETTGIKIDHFTSSQKRFLFCHGKIRGKGAFVLLQVGDDVMLFPWDTVYKIEGKTQSRLKKMCVFSWKKSERKYKGKLFRERLIEVLSTY